MYRPQSNHTDWFDDRRREQYYKKTFGKFLTNNFGLKDEKIEILEQTDLIRIYANSGKVYAVTDKGEYILRLRLYEIENRLPSNQFIRISNSEIINLKKVNNFDLSFTGTICVKLSNGITTYVSRRYVPKLKKILGIWGECIWKRKLLSVVF